MTSTASQPNTTPAPNNTAASSAPSYASAAGATKKPASTPLVVTGATNSSATVNQHAKTSSVSNMNGRSSVTPAVPTVAATPSVNGGSADHSRNGSVTIAANGPNSYLANGGTVSNKPPGIQFGYADASPAMPHSTPQQNSSAPMPIPGAGRAVSPATSPLPIPQLTSGGKPGNTENSFKIGSYTNDGDVSIAQTLTTASQDSMCAMFQNTANIFTANRWATQLNDASSLPRETRLGCLPAQRHGSPRSGPQPGRLWRRTWPWRLQLLQQRPDGIPSCHEPIPQGSRSRRNAPTAIWSWWHAALSKLAADCSRQPCYAPSYAWSRHPEHDSCHACTSRWLQPSVCATHGRLSSTRTTSKDPYLS